MEQAQLYLLLSPFALVLIAVCLVCALVNRKKGTFTSLLWFMILVMLTSLLSDLELLAGNEQSILLWSHMTYSCVSCIPVAWILFCREYSLHGTKTIPKAYIPLLLVVPLITAALAWTNSFHHLLWVANDFVPDGRFLINRVNAYGPWFWVHTAYSYLLYIGGMALIFRDAFSLGETRRRQSVSAIAGVSIPVAINLLYVFRLIPGIRRDYSSLAFSASVLFFLISIVRNQLPDSEGYESGAAGKEAEKNETMTRREWDVHDLLAKGMTTKEISEALCISENTVKTHTKHIYEKLHVKTKKELMETGRDK